MDDEPGYTRLEKIAFQLMIRDDDADYDLFEEFIFFQETGPCSC